MTTCTHCEGVGYVECGTEDFSDMLVCIYCDGSGESEHTEEYLDELYAQWIFTENEAAPLEDVAW